MDGAPMQLIQTLAAHRGHLLSAYRGSEWPEVAEAYGATGSTREEQLRGALGAVEAWARGLTRDPELLERLATFTTEAMSEVGPKTGATAGLAMIFANATANVGWWAEQRSSGTSYVATCNSCGASQQRLLEFTCQYCGSPLYEESP